MALLSWLRQSLQMLPELTFNPFLSLLLFLIFLYVYQHTRRSEPNLPPSPPKLPIIGNLHQLGKLPHRSLHSLSKKYGPLMFLNFGYVPVLVVSSANMARQILKTHDVVFSNRPKTTAATYLLYGCKDMAFSSYGEYWRQIRKLCFLELLSLKSVQSLQHVRDQEVEGMIKKIRRSCHSGSSVNLSEILVAASNNIMCTSICGQTFEEKDGKSRFGHLSRMVTKLLGEFCFGDFFPCLEWIDVLTGFIPNLKATFRELDALFDQLIEEHRTTKTGDNEPQRKDLIDILLKVQKSGMLDIELTQANLKAIILDMFVGGTDTTSTTTEWLMAELIKNPNVMKKAQEEVRRVVRKKSKIDMTDINQMDYLRCVIKETLRLHAPVPFLIPRETTTSVKLGGYDIPTKTRVLLNVWAIQRDPTFWEKPEEFLPERFLKDQIDFKGQDFEFLPFGGGRRGCPGLTFGVVLVEYLVANILCWFDWGLPGVNVQGEDLDMGEADGLVVSKEIPLRLVPVLHSP